MLSLSQNDIQLKQTATNKEDAIKALAASLETQGLVEAGYVNGMLAREAQNSTFLGNGIAIPHGTTDTRSLVKQTGVKVHHFPQGVNWGNGKTVYLAIGIAAKSDEHLGILKQLTKVLSADGVEEKLKNCESESGIISILNGEAQLEAEFDTDLVQLAFPATDLIQLTAVAAGLIKNRQFAGNGCVADAIATGATHLGQGIWLAKSNQDVSRTALSFVTPTVAFEENGQAVKGLIMIAACNSAHVSNLGFITQLIYTAQADKLTTADADKVVSLLTQETLDGSTAAFKIRNSHGLHARPGAMLVSVAKKFNSAIQVVNLNGEGKPANAKSLMKVIALGVKCGHELQFTAQGDDAELALESIGQAIADGLGEGK
ncbi:fused PTS fructose transporter subunit IIA/HPr protein [Photobacterium profundum]|uniref:Multiphosphoryl transfer protein n=1 Tax=Photobacterium profundum (strain SS9) TaxID=298386 RepID=Q6LRU2_PHOPR|nr:fused PTS fructose transporter subunit IIA/HPr protein [Photobacterium profundum]CAG19984.1 Putative PTS system, fructose-specific IIA/FPR component [Photobacterium profundum SS9]